MLFAHICWITESVQARNGVVDHSKKIPNIQDMLGKYNIYGRLKPQIFIKYTDFSCCFTFASNIPIVTLIEMSITKVVFNVLMILRKFHFTNFRSKKTINSIIKARIIFNFSISTTIGQIALKKFFYKKLT